MEKGISDKKDYKNEKKDEGKESECLDETSPVAMEKGVSDENNDNNEKHLGKRGKMSR